jgi:hypothetical protein
VTGRQTKFDLPDPGFEASVLEKYQTADTIALLSEAVESSKYDEIDVALQPAATSFKEATDYLTAHCASVEIVEFHWLEVRRCFVKLK